MLIAVISDRDEKPQNIAHIVGMSLLYRGELGRAIPFIKKAATNDHKPAQRMMGIWALSTIFQNTALRFLKESTGKKITIGEGVKTGFVHGTASLAMALLQHGDVNMMLTTSKAFKQGRANIAPCQAAAFFFDSVALAKDPEHAKVTATKNAVDQHLNHISDYAVVNEEIVAVMQDGSLVNAKIVSLAETGRIKCEQRKSFRRHKTVEPFVCAAG